MKKTDRNRDADKYKSKKYQSVKILLEESLSGRQSHNKSESFLLNPPRFLRL